MYGGIEMIKKILLTFLMVMMCGFANADQCFKLSPRAAASALSKDTEIQTKIVAAHRYEIRRNEASNKCHGGKINAESFWKLCSMAGIDIKTQNGKMQCYNKVADLIEHNGTYYRACGKDAAKLGAKAICVNVFKDIQVQVTQGIALAQEYVLKKFNLKGLKCNKERRKADDGDASKYTNQDFIQCYLPATNTYFEFEFDDLKESSDDRVKTDFARGICIAFNKDEYGTIFIPGRAFCFNTSESECKNINAVSKLYGGNAKLDSESYRKSVNPLYKKDDVCLIGMYNVIYSRKDLKTAYGIDNFMFCKGSSLQFQNTGGLTESLKTYVAKAAKVSASSVRCDAATKVYWGDGCNADIGSGYSGSDDIISCYVGTNQIDFVFDDVNEFSDKYARGAQQGIDCIVAGGTYNGKECMHISEQQCETLRQANLKNCPECKAVKWDGEHCTLPSSKTATNLKKGVDIAVIVGGAFVGIVVTFATAGESGAPVLAWVLTGIETVGAGMEIGAQLKIDGIADEFFAQSGKCKDAKCAEDLLKKYFDRLINVQGDMNEVEISAANEEIARLANIIPDDAPIWEQIGDNLTLEENAKGLFEGWEPEQIWRAVGIGLQFVSVGAALTKFVFGKSPRLQKATKVIARKLKNAKILKNAKKAKVVDASKISEIRHRIYPEFDKTVESIKNGKESQFFIIKDNKLSDEEWKILEESLVKDDLEMKEVSEGLFSVRKKGANIDFSQGVSETLKAYEKLDNAHKEIVDRLRELTENTWEYVVKEGDNQGFYRLNLSKLSQWSDEGISIENKLKHFNIKYEKSVSEEGKKYIYLIIREENIDEIKNIKSLSKIVEDAKKSGDGFKGVLTGWNVKNIDKVREGFRNSVFKFTENNSGKVYYLKHVPDMDEINRTKRAYDILSGKSDIVHTVKVVEDNQDVLIDFAAKNDLLKTSGEYWVLIEEVPTSKTPMHLLEETGSLESVLGGKPITMAEQNEIKKAIDRLNSGGVVHGDLEHNMFFMREPNGKLRVDIIDYEDVKEMGIAFVDDKKWFQETFDKLKQAGLADDDLKPIVEDTNILKKMFRKSEDIVKMDNRIGETLDNVFKSKIAEISRMQSQQANIERDFITKNKGMLFHGSATDYKEGKVQALSKAWQTQEVNAEGALFADPDFYVVKQYAKNGVVPKSVKDFSNTYINVPIPKKYADRFKDLTRGEPYIILSDHPRNYGYVYAVKPDGFRSAGVSNYMMIEHDVERIDRIAIPLDADVIFVREGAFSDAALKGEDGLIRKMYLAAENIDKDKNVLKNMQIYEECLEKLAKIIQ